MATIVAHTNVDYFVLEGKVMPKVYSVKLFDNNIVLENKFDTSDKIYNLLFADISVDGQTRADFATDLDFVNAIQELVFSKGGDNGVGLYMYDATASYKEGEIVIKDDSFFQANAYIPENTAFVIGETGATFREIYGRTALPSYEFKEDLPQDLTANDAGKAYVVRKPSGGVTVLGRTFGGNESGVYLWEGAAFSNKPISKISLDALDVILKADEYAMIESDNLRDGLKEIETSVLLNNSRTNHVVYKVASILETNYATIELAAQALSPSVQGSAAFALDALGGIYEISATGEFIKLTDYFGGLQIVDNTDDQSKKWDAVNTEWVVTTSAGGSNTVVATWKSNTNGGTYLAAAVINYNGTLYKNLTGVNTDTTPDNDAVNWEQAFVDTFTTSVPLWKSNTNGGVFAANAIINHGGVLYKNLIGVNTDAAPDVDVCNWVAYGVEQGYGIIHPDFTAQNTCNYIVTENWRWNADTAGWHSFSSDNKTWVAVGTDGDWVNLELPFPKIANKIVLKGGTAYPLTWKVEGSNDNSIFDLLYESNVALPSSNGLVEFEFPNKKPYLYYRYTIVTGSGRNATISNIAYHYINNGDTSIVTNQNRQTSIVGATLTLPETPIAVSQVFRNGTLLDPDNDYTLIGAVITFVVPLVATDVIISFYNK